MACMEHSCRVCDWTVFDNSRFTCCPDHPGETSHHWDEQYDDHDDYREDDEEEEDED